MADRNHTNCGHTFIYHGFQVRSDPTTRFVEEPGRADYTVTRDFCSVNVECKAGWYSFDMGSSEKVGLRPNQREWAQTFSEAEPFNTPYWIYLTFGGDAVHLTAGKERRTKSKGKPSIYQPDKTWLFPLHVYLEVENLIKPYQWTLPYMVRKGMNTEMQEKKYDAVTLLEKYELELKRAGEVVRPAWYGDTAGEPYAEKIWIIQEEHPFWRMLKQEAVARALRIVNQSKMTA